MNLVDIRVTVFELSRYIGALRTDGRTDGQTDGRSRRQYPFGPKGRGVKLNKNVTGGLEPTFSDTLVHQPMAFKQWKYAPPTHLIW